MLGAACCPLHVWRLHEVLCGFDPWMAACVGADENSDASAHDQRISHVMVAQALLGAIEALLADLHSAGARFRRTGMPVRIIRWRGNTLPGLLYDLCARHSALAHENSHHPILSGGDVDVGVAEDDSGYVLGTITTIGWPTGTLRRASEGFTCPLCAAVTGWDLMRMEGLRRAASGNFLYDAIIAMLQLALVQRPHWLCLPHWRRATATAERQATLTLLDVQEVAVLSLRGTLAEKTHRLTEQQLLEGADETASDVYPRAALILGGYPA